MTDTARIAEYKRKQVEVLEEYAEQLGFNHGAVLYMLCHRFGANELTDAAIAERLEEIREEIDATMRELPTGALRLAEAGKSPDDLVDIAEAAMMGNYERCSNLTFGGAS